MADSEPPLDHLLIEEYRRQGAPPAAGGPAELPPPIPLYQVLVAEYRSQGVAPSIDEAGDFVERLIREALPPIVERHAPVAAAEERARRIRDDLDAAGLAAFHRFLHAHGVRRSALCVSGGGIRSATFGLGVVQGLARRGLLSRFDYLSTVSGGGYMGSWLAAWIHRTAKALDGDGQKSSAAVGQAAPAGARETPLDIVQRELAAGPRAPLEPEPEPIRQLRSYTRYMSPRPGFLSADTWTLIGILLRNLLLNWLVLLPLIAAALMFPRLSLAVVRQIALLAPVAPQRLEAIERGFLVAATALGALVIAYFSACRPSLADAQPSRSRLPRGGRGQGAFLAVGLLPLWLFAMAATAFWAWTDLHFHLLFLAAYEMRSVPAFALFGAGLGLAAWALGRTMVRGWGLGELTALVLAAGLGGLLLRAVALYLVFAPDAPRAAEIYICFGAPILLFMFLVAATVFVGLTSRFTSDADREWLARAGSWILILILVRAGVSAIVVFGPVLLLRGWTPALASLGGISGVVTLVLGASARTPPARTAGGAPTLGERAKGLALALAAPLFAVFLLVLLSLATTVLSVRVGSAFFPERVDFHLPLHPTLEQVAVNGVHYAPWWLVLLVTAAYVAIGLLMGFFVNINRFSLHAAYRDRLIRAYLGTSRDGDERRPNPFTGFDEADNLGMAELAGIRPMPLLNLTLNLVHGRKVAWQDRKAEPFSVTPLHCGSYAVGYRSAAEYSYSETAKRGITLGTAMAISGAAASPNMGYHSSPAVTFLMTLFNARLGWWLGNPRSETYRRSGPRFAPRPLLAEAFGLTDDENPYIYLSDGGHFENLGLYEMVLRRCHLILASDAGSDPELQLADLGGAIAKIRIDLGVPIVFEKILMRPRDPARAYDLTRSGEQAPYAAIGRICYSCADRLDGEQPIGEAADGWLIYVKASLNGSEPVDVYHYARSHPAFPHESTAEQLYTEEQFESYRELGSHVIETLTAGLAAGGDLEQLAKLLADAQGQPPPCQPPRNESAAAAGSAAASDTRPAQASS